MEEIITHSHIYKFMCKGGRVGRPVHNCDSSVTSKLRKGSWEDSVTKHASLKADAETDDFGHARWDRSRQNEGEARGTRPQLGHGANKILALVLMRFPLAPTGGREVPDTGHAFEV